MTDLVTVTIRYFAGMREAAGCDCEALVLPAHSSVATILAAVAAKHPALTPYGKISRVAVGDAFVRGDLILQADDEVCIIPPVSGG